MEYYPDRLCAAPGCRNKIEIKSHHKYTGIPKYCCSGHSHKGIKGSSSHPYKGDNAIWPATGKLTIGEYKTLFKQQKGLCAICGKEETRKVPRRKGRVNHKTICNLHVDHDHTTGEVRGLLCSKCNIGLGQFMDNVEFLLQAIKYLNERKRL